MANHASPHHRGAQSNIEPPVPRWTIPLGPRTMLFLGALITLAGLMVVLGISDGPRLFDVSRAVHGAGSDPHNPNLAPAVVALRGSWEGLGPTDAPRRLVVEQVHPEWAVVHYHWGDHPIGHVQPGWVRVRAKVHTDGKLFWHYGGDFTFHLSEDRTTLMGAREAGGRSASIRLRRIPG